MGGIIIRKSASDDILGIHTSNSGASTGCLLYNIDGVRCWLPFIDRIEQRTFFKLTITSPSNVDVITSGALESVIDEWKEGGNSENHESVVTRQFLTECPINAHHLGIFAGKNTR